MNTSLQFLITARAMEAYTYITNIYMYLNLWASLLAFSILGTKPKTTQPHIVSISNECQPQRSVSLGFFYTTATNVRTGIQWTSLFCDYFVICGLIAQWPSEFNISIHRLTGDIVFVTKRTVKWAVIWRNLSSFEHLHFLIYPKRTFVRITA